MYKPLSKPLPWAQGDLAREEERGREEREKRTMNASRQSMPGVGLLVRVVGVGCEAPELKSHSAVE